jgi:hypothetical protein
MDLEDDSLPKGGNKKFIWAKPYLLALLSQKPGRFENRLSGENPGSTV